MTERSSEIRPKDELPWHTRRRPGSRRMSVIALLIISAGLLGCAAYTGWWLSAVTQLRDRTLAWIDDRRADGWELAYTDVSRRGFPLRLAVRFDTPSVAPSWHRWTWTASQLVLSADILDPHSLRLAIGGEQALDFGAEDASAGGGERYSGRADEFAFDLAPGGWIPNGRLSVRALTVDAPQGGNRFGIARLDLASSGDPAVTATPDQSNYAIEVVGDGVRFPDSMPLPLCRELRHIALDAKLVGGLEARPWPATLARWRNAGGTVEASRIGLACGPLVLDGDGTFALDKAGQPIAALSTHIQGYEAALDRLVGDRTIPAHTAAAAKILLRTLARSSGQGAPTLVAPISVQDRTLSVGPVSLLRLPTVHWLDGAMSAH